MAHNVQCRLCKQRFDTEKEETVVLNKQSYYHMSCYDEWVRMRNSTTSNGDIDFWEESVIDLLYRDVKMAINFVKFRSQWESFLKPEKKMTPKGIYFALRYYYIVKHGKKEDAQGGIGIVPFIYSESAQYWTALENKKEGTLDAIVKQITERQARPVTVVTKKKTTQKNEKWNLDNI